MVPKFPLISCNKLVKFLKKEDFIELRQSGSHKFFKHLDGRTTVVPIHNDEEIGRGLLKAILNEIDISREEFFKRFK